MERKYLSAQHRIACESIEQRKQEAERRATQVVVAQVASKLGGTFRTLK